MPRGRMLNKRISFDEEVAKLSPKAAILYTWCIPSLDFEGRIYADAVHLKGKVVPYLAYFSLKTVKKCTKEIGDTKLAILYGNKHKYMQFMGFKKNQSLKKDREAPSEIPPPTPELLRSNSRVTPAEVKLSKVKLSKDQPANTELFNKLTKKQKEDLALLQTKLLNQNFNLYTFMARFHKEKGYLPHTDIILKIGTGALKTKPKNLWGYFVGALKKEIPKHFADLNIQKAQKLKKEPIVIGAILKEMATRSK